MSNMWQRLAVLLWKEDLTLHDQSSVTSETIFQSGMLLRTTYRNAYRSFVQDGTSLA